MKIERECKIRVPDLQVATARLAEIGAQQEHRHYERNWVFDTPDESLRRRDMLLRLRTLDDASEGLLTVKRPAQSATFKNREEIEITVESASAARVFFSALGFEVKWYYEKHRTYWRHRGCEIALDELPEIGHFVEVEGPAEHAITLVLNDLGLNPADHISDNYLALFAKYCESHGQPLHDMRFAPTSKD